MTFERIPSPNHPLYAEAMALYGISFPACSCTALARFQMNWNRFCDLASIFQSDFNIHIFHCNIFCICHKISNCCQSIHYVCFIN